MKLSIIIPIYNEAGCISTFLAGLREAPIDQCHGISNVEIVFMNDGSTDETWEILNSELNTGFSFICGTPVDLRLEQLSVNSGKGTAISHAISKSTGDFILIQDADLEYSPCDYPTMLAPLLKSQADVVFGSRFVGSSRRVLFFWHSVANHLLTFVTNAICNINLTDMETGFKAFRGELVRSLLLKSRRFGIEPELTIKSARSGARIFEVPISYVGRSYEEGKKIRARDGIAALFHIVRFACFDREVFLPGLIQTTHALEKSVKSLYLPLLNDALKRAGIKRTGKNRILEVGSGTGSITQFLIPYGNVTATDISPEFISKLKLRFKNKPHFSTIRWDATAPFPPQHPQFDCIVAFNVLEHIQKDVEALQGWSNALQDGGSIILTIPNGLWLYSEIDKSVGHFRRYNLESVTSCIESAGLKVEYHIYGNPMGALGWFVQGILLKRREISAGDLSAYTFIKKIIWPIERILGSVFGLNLVVVARKEIVASQGQKRAA